MGVSWIKYKNTDIIFEDYTNLNGDELIDVLYQTVLEFRKLTAPIPVLIDFTNAFPNIKFMDELKRLGKKYDSLILKVANVGVNSIIKTILAKNYLAFTGQLYKIKYFNNIKDAKEFLVEP